MKYLVPLGLTLAPFCPHAGLEGFPAAVVFMAGVFLALVAYGKADMPLVLIVQGRGGNHTAHKDESNEAAS